MNNNLDINEWIRYAQMDYDAAKNMSVLFHTIPYEIVCFHCQQSAEKILKAYALANGEPLIKTHDLSILLAQCKKHNREFSTLDRFAIMLNDYAVIYKYPTKEDTVTEHDMNAALDNALKIMEFSKALITDVLDKNKVSNRRL